MRRALDEFYISGVSHNVSFLSAIMSHPRFQQGRLSTRFLEDESPGGFKLTHVSQNDPHLLTAIAGAIHVRVEERNRMISGQLPEVKSSVGHNWIVLVDDEQHAARVLPSEQGYTVMVHGERYEVVTDWNVSGPLFSATVNGAPMCVQVERAGLGYRLFHSGAAAHALVLPPRAAELYALMPVKRAPDLSRFLLSPMPGLLLSLHVREGEEVTSGQMLAIVEAMKMENVLRAKQAGVVAKILASPGESLSLGKPILEFAE
jgi:propionyl-CoA carboxylase alpha chain